MTIIVDWTGMCYNDSLHYLELAKKVGVSKPFAYWRNCTASLISSAFCMESFLNEVIKWKLSEIDEKLSKDYADSNMGFQNKLDLIHELLNLKIDKTDNAWSEIRSTISLRNDIAHFTRNTIFNDIKEKNAEIAINASRNLIKKFFQASNEDYHPRWRFIDEDKSKSFDR